MFVLAILLACIPSSIIAYHLLPRAVAPQRTAGESALSRVTLGLTTFPRNGRTSLKKGDENEEYVRNDYFQQLGFRRIVPERKETTLIGSVGSESQSMAGVLKFFIPGFVALWAVGYGAIFLAEISGNGLGDKGGFIGAGLAVFLLLALVGAAGYEVFKPLPSEKTL